MADPTELPLLDRPLDGVFAVRDGQAFSVRRFLSDVRVLSRRLPQTGYVMNLARDRYRFQVAFAAAITRGLCTLLPPNDTPGAQRAVIEGRPPPQVLHDGAAVADGLNNLDLRPALDGLDDPAPGAAFAIPMIPAEAVVSISFTSGSTGAGSEVARQWRTHFHGAGLNGRHYLHDLGDTGFGMVATVPAQHMYGMEVTVMAPLRLPVTVHAGKPLYPGDVATALSQLSGPRVLVSTPLHLKALVESTVVFPVLARVVTATAPLTRELAEAVEQRLVAELLDVYGCSEAGCMAVRRLADSPDWTALTGFRFEPVEDGGTRVTADHLPGPVQLQDHVVLSEDGRLELHGRVGDMVNVAGKRGSLAALTRLLCAAPGVTDGVVFQPRGAGRLAAVFTGTAAQSEVRRYLRGHIDPVLLPRPLLRVSALPRNELGKLPLAALEALLPGAGQES